MKQFRHESLGTVAVHHSVIGIMEFGGIVRVTRYATPQAVNNNNGVDGYNVPIVTERSYTASSSSMARIMSLVNSGKFFKSLPEGMYPANYITR